MTTAAFDQSVTDEINRRVACPCGVTVPHRRELRDENLAPHIAKIPLRAELRDLLQSAEIYDEQAARHAGEAAKCAELARCAREQAQNLVKCANL